MTVPESEARIAGALAGSILQTCLRNCSLRRRLSACSRPSPRHIGGPLSWKHFTSGQAARLWKAVSRLLFNSKPVTVESVEEAGCELKDLLMLAEETPYAIDLEYHARKVYVEAKDRAIRLMLKEMAENTAVPGSPFPRLDELLQAEADRRMLADQDRSMVYRLEELHMIPEPEWLYDPILLERSLSVVYGEPGAGKTFFMLDLAMKIQGGIRGKQANVVYCAFEGRSGFRSRINAWLIENGNNKHYDDFLLMASPFVAEGSGESLVPVQSHQSHTRRKPVGLLVLDTLANVFHGDENSQKDMGTFIQCIHTIQERLGCAVVVVHHSGKGERKGDLRGSSVLRGAVDTAIMLKGSDRGMSVFCSKQKDAEPFPPYEA